MSMTREGLTEKGKRLAAKYRPLRHHKNTQGGEDTRETDFTSHSCLAKIHPIQFISLVQLKKKHKIKNTTKQEDIFAIGSSPANFGLVKK